MLEVDLDQPGVLSGPAAIRDVTRDIDQFTFLLATGTSVRWRSFQLRFESVTAFRAFPGILFHSFSFVVSYLNLSSSGSVALGPEQEFKTIQHVLYILGHKPSAVSEHPKVSAHHRGRKTS